ncbi:TRAP-type C4-dicarboxylate transport system [Halalkalibacter wakoensis JCM 9140]|uniref:TRAP-type C4-dicarboxylate transport system n=1 Tax=Halalkalibacter wakoensis JCM 9140 TaxID=1236970 RepID=W4Q2N0_9BACI|nr:TRAP transporter substrate-binding protein [Halalkalibacter wakoensis]GAE25963.1 TRAP-type C4-dicarboxylate transport system [Halalkalibacter wakoensis JCM 9140]
MKKWLLNVSVLLVSMLFVVGCSSDESTGDGGENASNGSTEQQVLKLGHVWPSSEIHAQAVQKFKEEVEDLTDGALKIEIYENGSLGDDGELLEGLKIGTADIWVGGAGVLSGSSTTAQIFTVPFMFDSQDHFDNVYNGEVGEEISERIAEESGNRILSYLARGARMLTVDREVNTPEDLSGLKIRVPDSPVFVRSWETLGAAPTPMAFGEVFTALQQGVIDGQENPLSLIYNSKFNEVVDYLVKTEHVREPITIVISDSTFQALSGELQDALIQAANGEAKSFASEEVNSGEEGYLASLEEAGMTIIEPDLSLFQDKLDGFVESQFPDVLDIHEKIINAN